MQHFLFISIIAELRSQTTIDGSAYLGLDYKDSYTKRIGGPRVGIASRISKAS